MGCIYQITNLINNKIYIGSTWKELRHRKSEHLAYLRKGNHYNTYLQNAWNKYGECNFQFLVIEEHVFSDTQDREHINNYWLEREIYWITELKPQYNICKEISRGKLGRSKSQEEKDKIVKTRRENGDYERSNEYKDKISKSLLGNKHSKETKEKRAKYVIDRTCTKEIEVFDLNGNKITEGKNMSELARNFNMHISCIRQNLSGRATRAKDYIFKYKIAI